MVTRGPSGPSVARSYRAAEYCLTHYDGGGDARWRVARSLYFLTLTASSADDAAHLADRCMGLEVEDEDPAEAHFYLALCMGARALARNMEGLSLIPKMVEQAELAAEKNPKVAHAGPHRLLGGIYLRAPAWPLSVGDLDEALEHLEKARDLGPRWAENHLMLAEALIEDGRKDEARTAFDRARSLLREPESEGWRDLWRRDIDALAPKLGK
jgi:tetratricopeptide (TPR) repeat protein